MTMQPEMVVRPAEDRGRAQFGWLDSHHTFSFGQYYDPAHMGFGALRVINEDQVEPGRGFETHGHRDMEIISYVLDGALAHEDSMGNGSVIRRGDVQRMTAGTGVLHSEFNASEEEGVHFLQIWIEPEQAGLDPGYEQRRIDVRETPDRFRTLVSRDGRESSVRVHQDATLSAAWLTPGNTLTETLNAARQQWLQVAEGEVQVNGQLLRAGDGLSLRGMEALELRSDDGAEVLLFDLALDS